MSQPIRSASDTRAKLFTALQGLAEIVPEIRGGQLMATVGELCADLHGRDLWDAADTELLEAVWQFRRDFEAATASLNRQGAESSGTTQKSARRKVSGAS
jgi:hypothetical protein